MSRPNGILISAVLLAVVIGLAIPGVMRIRQTAERVRCRNNLRQLGLAMHNYHDNWRWFPPGTVLNPGLPAEKRLSWHILIAPYVDGKNPIAHLDRSRPWDAEANRAIVRLRYPAALCPSHPDPGSPEDPGQTHYVGIAGVGPDAAGLPFADHRAGVFGWDRKVRREDVTDGAGKTLMLAETAWDNGPWAAGGFATLRGFDPEQRPYVGAGRPFGGLHGDQQTLFGQRFGAANVLFIDGSVRLLNELISSRTWEALATIAGGEEVPNGF